MFGGVFNLRGGHLRFLIVHQIFTGHAMSDTVDGRAIATGTPGTDKPDKYLTVADLTRAIQIDPKNASNFRLRGAAYARGRQFDLAMADFDRATTLAPDDAVAYYLRGSIWHKKGSLVQAIFDYDKAIKLDPKNFNAIQAREVAIGGRRAADTEVGRSRSATTKSVWLRSLAIGGVLALTSVAGFWWVHVKSQDQIKKAINATALFHAEQGALFLNEGDFRRATSEYEAAGSLAPEVFSDYFGRGKARYGARDIDGAITDFGLALRIDPKNADIYAARGKAAEDKGNYDQAVSDYAQWVSLSPRNIGAYFARSSARSMRNDFSGAIADLDYVREIDPNNQEVQARKTDVVERWIKVSPGDAQARFARASVRTMNGDLNGAIADLDRILQLDPGNQDAQRRKVEAVHARAGASLRSKDYRSAVLDLEYVWKSRPSDQDIKVQYLDALTSLGFAYENGQGVPKDYVKAVGLYRLASDQALARAQNNLGSMYFDGHGVSQDFVEAARLFWLAANQGYALAQNNMGWIYANGTGVAQNYGEAIKWYRLAVEQGNALAQNNFGLLYERGQGVPKDYVEAIRLYRLAAQQDNGYAQFNLGRLYQAGLGVPQNYGEAARWYRSAVSLGNTDAASSLAFLNSMIPGNAQLSFLLDLNTASKSQLDSLPQIGPARSEAIIRGRPYNGKNDLIDRGIIPQSVYDAIKDKVVVKR